MSSCVIQSGGHSGSAKRSVGSQRAAKRHSVGSGSAATRTAVPLASDPLHGGAYLPLTLTLKKKEKKKKNLLFLLDRDPSSLLPIVLCALYLRSPSSLYSHLHPDLYTLQWIQKLELLCVHSFTHLLIDLYTSVDPESEASLSQQLHLPASRSVDLSRSIHITASYLCPQLQSFGEIHLLTSFSSYPLVLGSRIPKIEWEDLIVKFNAKTKLCWPKHALKNRWDALRKDWTLWTKMMSKDTGIGWNPELGTVDATNEWWEERFKENKEYAKFRKHGFKFKQELEFCFAGTYATGAYRRAPSSGVVQTQNTSVRIENQNQEDSDGFQAWFDDEPYVPDPPLQDLNIDISPVRVVNEHHDEVYSTATSPLKVQSVTPTHTNGSFRKRSSQMSGSRIRKKQATNKDEHMVELVQAV
ncbi:uncharacterized protein LOC119996030 [Tripterygium wilfordii]|uniref:uncharacterized protein LOC119996030 n=1 Tax=Tripterygium wilfordii TaxID=458696 RepID=UPI0018F80DCC|nr:uncharacterized protein LOC119996030 [Tripterygium wilfordii]